MLLLILEFVAEQHLVEVVGPFGRDGVEDEVGVLLVFFRFVLHLLPFFIQSAELRLERLENATHFASQVYSVLSRDFLLRRQLGPQFLD